MKQTFCGMKREERYWSVRTLLPSLPRASEEMFHLVEEVLDQLGNAYVVIVSVDEQHLLEVFKLGDGVVAVPHCLAALFTHNA